jgi:hypothetical protein
MKNNDVISEETTLPKIDTEAFKSSLNKYDPDNFFRLNNNILPNAMG